MGRQKKTGGKTSPSGEPSPVQTTDRGKLDLIKAKLKAKYHLLRDEPLPQDSLDELKDRVCVILGLNRPALDNVLIDL